MLFKCCGFVRNKAIQHLSNVLKPKVVASLQCRNLHLAPIREHILKSSRISSSHKVLIVASIRNISELSNSQSADPDLSDTLPKIPDAPEPLPPIPEVILPPGAEPSFESLGLGGYTPVGLIESALEYVHISLNLPWWATIMCGTLVVRTLLFPLVIIAQRNAMKMSNSMPEMQVLQLKMTEARQTGNRLEAARCGQELYQFMKDKDLRPFRSMLVPIAQAPIFISFFMSLREMANAPVESLKEGGLYWFTDLTLPDQFYLLPIITSGTLFLTILVGTDTARLSHQNAQMMKYFLMAMPIIIFPFTMNFPGTILCYWTCSNFFSLIQVGFLRIPKVRDFFKIERAIKHNPEDLPVKKKPFIKGFKESYDNMKISNEVSERERVNAIQFERAGSGPLIKTYKFDPTKVQKMPTVLSSTSAALKKKD